jgi:CubicO group peptidase (beta-lactamase class C family)
VRRALLLVLIALVPGACTGPDPDAGPDASPRPAGALGGTLATLEPPPERWPGETWDVEERGEWSALDAAASASASTCVTVVQDGQVVHRWTAPGADERTAGPVYSVTKSITALLVAAAVADGVLSLDDRVSDHVPQWRGGPSADVTVDQLLTMTSGRRWTYELDYGGMVRGAADTTAFALGVGQEHEPGTHWEYDNMAVQVLGAVLRAATEQDVGTWAQGRLLGPLGLRDTTWERDDSGRTTTYSGVRASCDDVARIGLLVARDGRWDGRQLVPADLVRRFTGQPGSELNAAYGRLWWVNAPGRVQTIERAAGFGADRPPREGRLVEGVPDDARWALGYGNQVLAVVPSRDLVVVRLGARPASADVMGLDEFTRLALSGLPREP